MGYVAISPFSFLQLFCYVRDDDYKHAFEVKIRMNDSVASLKQCIKEVAGQTFRDVDANTLVLWNENIPLDEHLKEAVHKLGLVDKKSLSPATRMSELFPKQPEEGLIHIVVKRGEYFRRIVPPYVRN